MISGGKLSLNLCKQAIIHVEKNGVYIYQCFIIMYISAVTLKCGYITM
jgi:hypothetical protein